MARKHYMTGITGLLLIVVLAAGSGITTAEPAAPSANSGWEEVGAGAASGGGISNTSGRSDSPAHAVTPGGAPVVVWDDDRGDGEEIYLRTWNGSTWAEIGGSATGGGISSTPGASTSPSVAIAADGAPIVAWEAGTGTDYEIFLRRWNGTSWAEMGGSASGGGISNNSNGSYSPSLIVGTDGTPIVAWYDAGGGDWEIYVKRWNGSAWIEMGSGSAAGGGISNNSGASRLPALALGPGGLPVLAWEDDSSGNLEIYVRQWNGSSWVEMGSGSAAGGGISNNSGASIKPKPAAGPDGTLLITWEDDTDGDAEIYVRRWNGSAWVEMGSGSAAGGGISNNGGPSSAPVPAIGPDGTAIIAWHDRSGSNMEAFVRRWNGSAWIEMEAGSATGGGISNNAGNSYSPAPVIAPDGRAFIVWADTTSGNYEIYARSNPPVTTTCYTLSISVTGSGIVSMSPQKACYSSGELVTLTAMPNSGNIFSQWSGSISGNTNPYFLAMNGNKSVTATFIVDQPPCYTLSRSHTGSGADPTASPANSSGCGTGRYTAGQAITLMAAPLASWSVAGWTGTANDSSNSISNSLIMPAKNHAVGVTYTFEPPPCYTLTLTHSGSGSDPTANPANSTDCTAGRYIAGQVVTLAAAPATGHRVKNWGGTANDGSASMTNSLTIPASNHIASVTYEPVPAAGAYLAFAPAILFQPPPQPVCFPGPNEIEPNNSAASANGPLCNGRAYKGLPNDEYDVFYVDLKHGGNIVVTMTNHPAPNVQLALHYQIISSNALDIDANGSDGFRVANTNGQPGRYLIVVYVPKQHTGSPGQYTLQATFTE